MQHFQVAPDDDAGAAQFAQHIGHQLIVVRDLVVQPDVAEREADLFEQVENQFQLGVGERFAGDAPVENGDPDDAVAVGNRHGHLRAKQFKFYLRSVSARASSLSRRKIRPSRTICPPMPESSESSKCSSRPAERPMAEAARRRRLSSGKMASFSGRTGAVQKNRGAVDAQDFAEKQKELLQHRLGIQRVGEDGRKIAQHFECWRGLTAHAWARFGARGKMNFAAER